MDWGIQGDTVCVEGLCKVMLERLCLSYRTNLHSPADLPGVAPGRRADLPAVNGSVINHSMCLRLYGQVLCLPCHAEFSLPWLIFLQWRRQQHYSLDLQEWSPCPQQKISPNRDFIKKTKILSIFSQANDILKLDLLTDPPLYFCLI